MFRRAIVPIVAILAIFAALLTVGFAHSFFFAKLPPRLRHVAIYDAFCKQIKRHYFDVTFSGVDWKEIDRKWREKAAAATDDSDLYWNVLQNIAIQFPASHIGVWSPTMLRAEIAQHQPPGGMYIADAGFDMVILRRGTVTSAIVGDVLPGGAAGRAGIEPGWAVLTTNTNWNSDVTRANFTGRFLRLTAEQVAQYERTLNPFAGMDAAQVSDAVSANTITLEFELTRPPARLAFETRNLPGGSEYIRFDTFADGHVVDQVLAALDQAGPEGVVMDLRRNFGGFVSEVRRLMDRVLKQDAYIGTERSRSEVTQWRVDSFARKYSGPLVVLVGPITGSAAEIFAAAIQDNARGRLVGRMTNGSVLTTLEFPLPDGGGVKVPVADFTRASGKRIEGVGIEPDIRVIPSLADIRAGRDPAMERAILELESGSK